jgi:putative intracellular protease/amidase
VKIAVLIYENFTALDAVGPYEVLSRLPNADLVFVAEEKGPVRTETRRLAITADATLDEVPQADILVIPGGKHIKHVVDNPRVHDWIRAIDQNSTWTTTVCVGSVILAATGLLKGRKATTHWLAMADLETYGAIPTEERVVFQEKYVTAAGVSAGIDMALTLAAKTAGDHTAQAIQLGIEYDPEPPFNAGSPKKAPTQIIETLKALRPQIYNP